MDDGVGGNGSGPPGATGNGLAGLRDRVAAAGGVVDAGPAEPRDGVYWCHWRHKPALDAPARGAGESAGRRGTMTVRLLLADDQELVRSALAALLDLEDDFEVVATVGRGDEVVAAAKAHHPDVALLDIEMPGIDGLAAAGVLAQEVPECRSLILTTFGRPGYLRRAMESGASGFVVKDVPAEQLADAIRRVMAGERVVDPALAAETLASGTSPLTARERDVLVAARPGSDRVADRREALPFRRDGPQLPLGGHGQNWCPYPGRSGQDGRRTRLALGGPRSSPGNGGTGHHHLRSRASSVPLVLSWASSSAMSSVDRVKSNMRAFSSMRSR